MNWKKLRMLTPWSRYSISSCALRYIASPPHRLQHCIVCPKFQKLNQDYMSGKVKKVEILKKWSSKSGWNILTKAHFWAETFFQMPLETFYELYENLQGIWRVRQTYLFTSVKKNQDRMAYQSDYMSGKGRELYYVALIPSWGGVQS